MHLGDDYAAPALSGRWRASTNVTPVYAAADNSGCSSATVTVPLPYSFTGRRMTKPGVPRSPPSRSKNPVLPLRALM